MIVIIRVPHSRAASWLKARLTRPSKRTFHNGLAWPFGLAAAALALSATTTADIPATAIAIARTRPQVQASQPDPRFARLAAIFHAYNCPPPHYIENYIHVADAYRLDYRLLPAISIRETTCGVTEKQNNRWGYHPGRQTFSSVEAGIEYVARQLAANPPYRGKTLNDKLFTYNPRPAYPGEVQQIMRQIE